MHIYAFGSLCRGDVASNSDIDLLAIVDRLDLRFDPELFSIYSYSRINELWEEGNPFAWHLALESSLIFSSTQENYIKQLGNPKNYRNCISDCEKFLALFQEAYISLKTKKFQVYSNYPRSF